MKLTITKHTIFLLAIIAFCACNDDLETSGVSRITQYPSYEFIGGNPFIAAEDNDLSEIDVVASSGGQQFDVSISSVFGKYTNYEGSTIPASGVDEYTVTYSSNNADGFPSTAERTIYRVNTGDLTQGNLSGLYLATAINLRTSETFVNTPILIWQTGTNTFELTHGMGGFFIEQFGSNGRVIGTEITVNNPNTYDVSFSAGFSVIDENFRPNYPAEFFSVDIISKTINFGATIRFSAANTTSYQITLVQQSN